VGLTSARNTFHAFAPQGVHPLRRVSILVVAQTQLAPSAMAPSVHLPPVGH
jgi:hypothetical protein